MSGLRGAARCGRDIAGGMIIGPLSKNVYVNNKLVSVIGDPVAGHGPPPHSCPVMITGSRTVFAQNIPVCRLADVASCLCPAVPCSQNVFIG